MRVSRTSNIAISLYTDANTKVLGGVTQHPVFPAGVAAGAIMVAGPALITIPILSAMGFGAGGVGAGEHISTRISSSYLQWFVAARL